MHNVVWTCAGFKLKRLSLDKVFNLESNIKLFLGPHLIA